MPLSPAALLPAAELRDLDGRPWALQEAWAGGEALFLIGHSDCRTTRLTLPWVDLIQRRRAPGTTVLAILQDDAAAALALRDALDLELPLLLESNPYPLAKALGVAVVPTLFHVARDGRLASVVEAFDKEALEALAARFGAALLFAPDDTQPPRRPG